MPFTKGQPRPNGAGRKKGSPTKLSKEVASRLEALGCDPIEGMARVANDNTVEVAIRVRCYAELAQYVYPKRRATEHSGLGGGPILIDTDPYDAIERELSRLAERGRTQPVHSEVPPRTN